MYNNYQFRLERIPEDFDRTVIFDKFDQVAYINAILFSIDNEDKDDVYHHLCLKFNNKLNDTFVRNLVRENLDELNLNDVNIIEQPHDQKWEKMLKTSSRFDDAPLTKNIDRDELSFRARVINWANKNPKFQYTHAFVAENCMKLQYLQKAHHEVRENNTVLSPLPQYEMLLEMPQNAKWQEQVIEWWNEWAFELNCWTAEGRDDAEYPLLKHPQIYIYGRPNLGKTYLINHMLEPIQHQVFIPSKGERFSWETWSEKLYNVVFMDEFNIRDYHIETWKKAAAGESFSADKKGEPSEMVRVRCPIVMVSNQPPPNNVPGFQERVLAVQATGGELIKLTN